MNLTPLQRLLLLEQSGELSRTQRAQLDAELAASAEARQQQDVLRALADAIPPVEAQPAPDAAVRIAARLQQTPTPAPSFRPIWKPALAVAAALALLFGVRAFRTPSAVSADPALVQVTVEEEIWADPFEADFAEIESLLAAIDTDDSAEFIEL